MMLGTQEDEVLFCRTIYGIMKNIEHLCSRKNSQTWGPDAWKKVCFYPYPSIPPLMRLAQGGSLYSS
jgi:hypothetical protein